MVTNAKDLGSRRITVRDSEAPLSYLNMDNEEVDLGIVRMTNFGNENLRSFAFHPHTDNPWMYKKAEEGIVLGRGSQSMSFLNFADAQRPLVEAGMSLQKLSVSRAGAEMLATYTYEDKPLNDPWGWDAHLWGDRSTLRSIFPAVTLKMSLTVGRLAAKYSGGLYRLICTNGLVGTIVGGFSHDVRHLEGSVDSILELMDSFDPVGTVARILDTQEVVATQKGMEKALSTVNGFLTAQDEAAKTKSPLDAKWSIFRKQFTAFNTTTTPKWATQNFATFLDALVTSERGEYTVIDIANAYTGGINSRLLNDHDERGVWWAGNAEEQVISATASIARLATLFSEN